MSDGKLREVVSEIVERLRPLREEEREAVLAGVAEVFCRWCGRVLDGQPCYCRADD